MQSDGKAASPRQNLGICPLCQRPMLEGGPLDRHHFVPKSRGGREAQLLHKICHRQLHALWTNAQLATLNNPEDLRAEARLQPFLKWIARKHPDFYQRTASNAERRKRHGQRSSPSTARS